MASAKTIVGITVPKRLRSTTLRKSSILMSKMVLSGGIVAPGIFPPAQFTRISTFPYAASTSEQFFSRISLSVTSVLRNMASCPSDLIPEASALPFSSLRARIATLAPWEARYLDIALPRTPLPPVMTATLPSISNRLFIILRIYLTSISLYLGTRSFIITHPAR